jgi:hypothetical protein
MPGSMAERKQQLEEERARRLAGIEQSQIAQTAPMISAEPKKTWGQRFREFLPTGATSEQARTMPTTLTQAQAAMEARRKPARFEARPVELGEYYSPEVQEFLGRTPPSVSAEPMVPAISPKPGLWQRFKAAMTPEKPVTVRQPQATAFEALAPVAEREYKEAYPVPGTPEYEKGLKKLAKAYREANEAYDRAIKEEAEARRQLQQEQARTALEEQYYTQYGIAPHELREIEATPVNIAKSPALSPEFTKQLTKTERVQNFVFTLADSIDLDRATLVAIWEADANKFSKGFKTAKALITSIGSKVYNDPASIGRGLIALKNMVSEYAASTRAGQWFGTQYGRAKEYAGKKLEERAKWIEQINKERELAGAEE